MAKFKAVLDNSDILRDGINTVSSILTEGVFKLSKDGIQLKSMDAANVSLVDLRLLSSAFSSFDIDKDTEIGLNIGDLTSVLKRAKPKDKVTLELKGNVLSIELSGSHKRSFNIPLLDIKQEAKSPDLNFSVNAKLKTSVLEDGISDAEIVGDALIFEADSDSLKMLAKNENRKSELILEQGNESLINLSVDKKARSMFPLDYLKKIIKASKLSPECDIHLGDEYPMKLNFKVVDKIQLSFILAPRIEND